MVKTVCTSLSYSNPAFQCIFFILYFQVAIVKGFIVRTSSYSEPQMI